MFLTSSMQSSYGLLGLVPAPERMQKKCMVRDMLEPIDAMRERTDLGEEDVKPTCHECLDIFGVGGYHILKQFKLADIFIEYNAEVSRSGPLRSLR